MASLSDRIAVAVGKIPADLVFQQVHYVDVFNRRILTGDVAVYDGVVCGIGSYRGIKEMNCAGRYLLPGFTDAHAHIESSMITPAEYAAAVLPRGVTTVIADPHEIMNVCGEAGLQFMLNSTASVPMDIHFMLPSCVPAAPVGTPGQIITAADTAELLGRYPVLGLGEMMNYVGLLNGDQEVLDKLKCSPLTDGHAPQLSGNALNAYLMGGIATDHECSTPEEALEKISRGMYVLIREGTGAKNLIELLPAVTPQNLHRFCFCTDDKHVTELLREGTIGHCVDLAIAHGMSPVDAVSMAAYHAPCCYGLRNRGAIAPGYAADLLLCDALSASSIRQVYKDGVLVAEDGKAVFPVDPVSTEAVCNTVQIAPLLEGSLAAPFDSKKPVIEVLPGSLLTKKVYCTTAEGLSLCAVVERHHAKGTIGTAYVKNLPIQGGAVAQTIGHDNHNITVIGDNEPDMHAAVAALGKSGGIVVVSGGKTLAAFSLPVAGLMSDLPLEAAAAAHTAVETALTSLCGNAAASLLMLLSFLSLPVIPELKLTDLGLVDVATQTYV
jgi:adenine deaminase